MPTGSYPGCCRFFTGVSSGGTCSRLSGSARLGIDDGWNIRCAFHGGATSSLVDGTPWAFTGDTRPSTIAAAGAGAILRPHRRSEVVERDFPRRCSLASNHENANARFITCPLGSDRRRCVSMIDHCPKKHREPLTEAPVLAVVHIVMSTERCVVRLGGPLPRFATRVTRKSFRAAKEFALQRDDTMAAPDVFTSCRVNVQRSRSNECRRDVRSSAPECGCCRREKPEWVHREHGLLQRRHQIGADRPCSRGRGR